MTSVTPTHPKTILVVDDTTNLRRMVADYLRADGYTVTTAATGLQALDACSDTPPDLVVLDIMMPEMDGYGFLKAFRRQSDAPVIMLTAKLEESDKVHGLDLGADDYVTKPFGMRELTARIRAVLRRADRHPRPDRIAVNGVVLDRDARSVAISDETVTLTPTEFALLSTLMTQPGRVFSRLELLTSVQGNDHEASERIIDAHVKNLRAKIEPDPKQPRYVESVYGAGYRFTEAQDDRPGRDD